MLEKTLVCDKRIILVLLLSACQSFGAWAADIPVPPGAGTLAQAISDANPGDRLLLETANYTHTGNLHIEKSLTLQGSGGNAKIMPTGGGVIITGADTEVIIEGGLEIVDAPTLSVLDVDGNGGEGALTDGLLIIRHLFGLSGDALIAGAVASDCTRCTAAEIVAAVEAVRSELDVDGNGSAEPLTDGLLIIRYLFGLRGTALIDGAVASDATRTTATQIEDYLAGLIP